VLPARRLTGPGRAPTCARVGHVHVDATIRGRRPASGRTVRLPTALGGIRIDDREAATIFWIGPCDEPLLGVETLEALGLSVDPARARLRATRPYATRLGGFGRR